MNQHATTEAFNGSFTSVRNSFLTDFWSAVLQWGSSFLELCHILYSEIEPTASWVLLTFLELIKSCVSILWLGLTVLGTYFLEIPQSIFSWLWSSCASVSQGIIDVVFLLAGMMVQSVEMLLQFSWSVLCYIAYKLGPPDEETNKYQATCWWVYPVSFLVIAFSAFYYSSTVHLQGDWLSTDDVGTALDSIRAREGTSEQPWTVGGTGSLRSFCREVLEQLHAVIMNHPVTLWLQSKYGAISNWVRLRMGRLWARPKREDIRLNLSAVPLSPTLNMRLNEATSRLESRKERKTQMVSISSVMELEREQDYGSF